MRTIAAFFDIDGTLYREALLTQMFKKMIRGDMIDSKVYHEEVKEHYNRWSRRIGDYDDYLIKMAEIYFSAVKGLHVSQITYIANKVVEQNGDKVYTYTRDQIKWHKERDHKIIGVSGAPYELVEAMAKKYGFEDFIATHYAVDEHMRYTGEFKPMWDSRNKKIAIEDFVNSYNIALDFSYAYGDTAGDFDMLNLVAHPVAINPTKELLNMIKSDHTLAEKIQVVVERKDMIYHLNSGCIDAL
ncbi:MAG: HAD-IB family hydrolase [Vallitaleaceae bacterium]|jgi:HAD superfamily hydrolase (TIGR01490 family)|nr:HAD-IB family hydrolase [Vallitaleaceae bacterium]